MSVTKDGIFEDFINILENINSSFIIYFRRPFIFYLAVPSPVISLSYFDENFPVALEIFKLLIFVAGQKDETLMKKFSIQDFPIKQGKQTRWCITETLALGITHKFCIHYFASPLLLIPSCNIKNPFIFWRIVSCDLCLSVLAPGTCQVC